MSHIYSQPYFAGHMPVAPPVYAVRGHNVELVVRQQPTEALVSIEGKEKTRKPIDPPPIIELKVNNPSDPTQQWLQSPYFFVVVDLIENGSSKRRDGSTTGPLIGTLASSLHRLKDNDNKDGGFFIFADISAVIQGTFTLRFSLFELQENALMAVYLGSVESDDFRVVAAKDFKGLAESTVLSRSFSDQGVRLRLRKEPRGLSGNKRKFDANEEKEKPEPPNMTSEPSSSYEESSSPNKRFKEDTDDRKDSHPGAHTHMPTSAYANPSYTSHSSYTALNHASSRYNTLPEPSGSSMHNFNVSIGMQGNYSRASVNTPQSYHHPVPMANPAALYRQPTLQAPINGTIPNSMPHQQLYNSSNNIYQYVQPRTRTNEPMNYPAYPDDHDYGGHSLYPPSQ
jgi:hypothetical protein